MQRDGAIVFVVGSLDTGGTELNAFRTAKQLHDRGHDVVVIAICSRGPLGARYADEGVPIRYMPTGSLWKPKAWITIRRLNSTIRSLRPQVVHAHDAYSNVVTYLSRPWHKRTKFIVSQRFVLFPSKAWARLNRLVFRRADRVLVNAPTIARLVHDQAGVAEQKIAVIRNHIDDSSRERQLSFRLEAIRHDLQHAKLVFTCVARLSAVKNHAMLFEAFAATKPKEREWTLVVIGEGAERPALVHLANELEIADRIMFVGELPSSPSPHLVGDVAVLSSIAEGFPNSLLEAMAVSKPIVATRVGGIPDVVRDGSTGFLVDSRDTAAFAAALIKLGEDKDLRLQFGNLAEKIAIEEHGADFVVESLRRLYAC